MYKIKVIVKFESSGYDIYDDHANCKEEIFELIIEYLYKLYCIFY